MNLSDKRWDIPKTDWSLGNLLVKDLGISPITAQILINRGITSSTEARLFLESPLEELASPWKLPGMKAGVRRILGALGNSEKILIFGDYDVDGMTATALLMDFLREIGGDVAYYIPERSDGYGLNNKALDWAKEQGYGLIITVDCGISAIEEIAYGKELGLDFVVTDHHEPSFTLPDAEAVINPKLNTNLGEIKELAGVGVAFKLAQGLGEELGLGQSQIMAYLDLVALGTIADVVPLAGENRLLVKHGLPLLSKSQRVGIKALLEVAGVEGEGLNSIQVAFRLAPRLNAAGRMASPIIALELLLTASSQKARELALRLQELNTARQILEQQTMKEALVMIKEEADPGERILVLASPLWHPGVLGIVASKLGEKFFQPVILLTIEGEQAKGSGRSIPGFNLYQALRDCNDLLLKAGGHALAVGLTIEAAKLEEFRNKINQHAFPILGTQTLMPALELETEVLLGQLDFQLLDELARLEPFGQGNPEPIFALRHASLKEYRGVGKEGRHLKFQVSGETKDMDGIGFNLAGLLEKAWDLDKPMDLAFRLGKNHWNGQTKMQLLLEDMKEYQDLNLSGAAIPTLPHCRKIAPQPLEHKRVYQCVHGGEQFQNIVNNILEATYEKKPVHLLFPSQRILAVYERLLQDNLLKYGISCRRLKSRGEWEQEAAADYPRSTVFLSVQGYFQPTMDQCKTIRLTFPDCAKKKEEPLETKEVVIGFKELYFRDYEFLRKWISPENKLSYIIELIKAKNYPLFIYANRKKQIMELFQETRELFPEKKHQIWCYHQGLCTEQKEMILGAVSHGLADVVFASEFLELRLPTGTGAKERVIVDAPYNFDELFLKSRPQGEGIKVHGIWHEQELKDNEMILQTIFPSDELLEKLALTLMEMSVSQETGTPNLLADLRYRFAGIQSPTVRYALDIIDELRKNQSHKAMDYKTTYTYQVAEGEKKALARLKNSEQKEPNNLIPFLLSGTSQL